MISSYQSTLLSEIYTMKKQNWSVQVTKSREIKGVRFWTDAASSVELFEKTQTSQVKLVVLFSTPASIYTHFTGISFFFILFCFLTPLLTFIVLHPHPHTLTLTHTCSPHSQVRRSFFSIKHHFMLLQLTTCGYHRFKKTQLAVWKKQNRQVSILAALFMIFFFVLLSAALGNHGNSTPMTLGNCDQTGSWINEKVNADVDLTTYKQQKTVASWMGCI